jgi:diadenosine tetraphosphatase ApaH/serine/threonine PP2A family protein phosphatase
VIGGDVLPGPMPRECLDCLTSLEMLTSFVRGNGDRETVAAARGQIGAAVPAYFHDAIRWNGAQLSPGDQQIIETWPLSLRMTLPGLGALLFCHATPRDDNEIFTVATADEKLQPLFDAAAVDVVVCGHTHMQFDRMVGTTRVVNAGSVGMPFDTPGAYWLLLGSAIELRRTDYDLQEAARRVRQTRYPLAEEFASKSILTTPSRQSMIDALSKAELQ